MKLCESVYLDVAHPEYLIPLTRTFSAGHARGKGTNRCGDLKQTPSAGSEENTGDKQVWDL